MKKLVLIMAAALLAFSACDSDDGINGPGEELQKETRQVANFHSITNNIAAEFFITPSDSTHWLEIEAEPDILNLITVSVNRGVLTIDGNIPDNDDEDINIYVGMTDFDTFVINGVAVMRTTDVINVQNLEFEVNGVANIEFSGVAKTQTISIDGTADFLNANLATENTTIDIGGVSNRCEVRASETLNVTISGIGAVSYIGDPQVSRNITGVGSVTRLQR